MYDNVKALKTKLDSIAELLDSFEPEDLIVTDEDAMAIANEIVASIPENVRFLLPKDNLLAAIAYAEAYYSTK